MDLEGQERRESKRVFFDLEDNIGVTLSPAMSSIKAIPGTLLSLSSGGLSIAAPKNQRKNIQEGDILVVANLQLPDTSEPITRIEVEVKYIIFYKKSDRITIGCVFKRVAGLVTQQIGTFIKKRIEAETEEEEESGGITVA
ncbi:MAG: PilZ domain-containing protein [Candidatus Aminicenantes bacterium]|jgi:c-di-GMP-binding flagellar brake protein YcgR